MTKISYPEFTCIIEWHPDVRKIDERETTLGGIVRLFIFDVKEYDGMSNNEPLYFVIHYNGGDTTYVLRNEKRARSLFEKIRTGKVK